MKKKIALFANGWSADNLFPFSNSLIENLAPNSADIYTFLSHESYGQTDMERRSQSVVYSLPDLSSFDAAIVFGAGLNFSDSIKKIYDLIDSAKIPTISICNHHEGNLNIDIDNYSGMLEMCNHVIETHGRKNILYLAGSAENNDSNIRQKALFDSLASHNLPQPDVCVTNWEVTTAIAYLEKLHEDGTFPDAIMCANDGLAVSSALALERLGYNIPEDVIVTGFDHQLSSQIFYPSIASVDQHFDEIGKITAKALDEIFCGQFKPQDITIECSFYPGESCGCDVNNVADELRKQYAHDIPNKSHSDFLFNVNMVTLEQAILQSRNADELIKAFNFVFANRQGSEGDSFFAIIDPVFANIGRDDYEYTPFKFNETLYMAEGKCCGHEFDACNIKKSDLIPSLEEYKENKFHIFSIFFYQDMMCGYLVFTNNLKLMKEGRIYDFSNKLNRISLSLRRNFQLNELNTKLSELMEQDTLTHVKNRAAYEKYLKKLEADFIEGENPPFAVVYFDINNLKMVNDMYGHEKGDAYIRNSCRLMCNTFKHSPVFRIGGDEFVSILLGEDYTNRLVLIDDMNKHMKLLKEKGASVPLTERISIASGMAEYDRTLDTDFSSIFKRADEIMYENKYKMKKDLT